jgi:hypothetical protein
MRPFTGTIAFCRVPTADGRVLQNLRGPIKTPIPVLGYGTLGMTPPIGTITTIKVLDDGQVWAEGEIGLPPGVYGCGIEITKAVFDTKGGPGYALTIIDGELGLLVVYLSDARKPAWPAAQIEVA